MNISGSVTDVFFFKNKFQQKTKDIMSILEFDFIIRTLKRP